MTAISDDEARATLAALDARAHPCRTPYEGGTMQWRRWGDAGGPPLVLLHGGGGAWAHWVRNIPALSARRTVWAPDLPGFGDSDDAPGDAFITDVVRALRAGLEQVLAGRRPFDVAGFSFGGIAGALLAADWPGAVRRLVIVGSTGLGIGRELGLRSWRRERDPAAREAAHVHNLRALMLAHHDPADRLAVAIHARNVERGRVDGRRAAITTLLRDAIARIAAHGEGTRVIGMWGERDATAQPDVHDAERVMRTANPALRFHVIPGAGHWAQYEAAERFDALLEQVLDEA